MPDFDTVWSELQTYLQSGNEIESWNTYHGYLGEYLTIKEVHQDYISIDPPRVWNTQVILKDDFEQIWQVWGDYKALRLKRAEIGELTDYSKYIISILRWHETEVQARKSQIPE